MIRTWILGAGFSRSLGGPLLDDLFSERSAAELVAKFDMQIRPAQDRTRWLAVHLCRWGNENRWWSNAEDYLDRLDSAVAQGDESDAWNVLIEGCEQTRRARKHSGEMRNFIQGDRKTILRDILLEAKRWMAAECCAFTKDADVSTEKWEPYRRWADYLTEHDRIITFNYDRVLELLIDNGCSQLQIITPSNVNVAASGFSHVLKLHGSVDWHRDEKGNFVRSENQAAVLHASLDDIGIATPGVHKASMVEKFNELWRFAERLITDADIIIFVGYRFPQTDAEARRRLLTALRLNKQSVNIQTVLGQDTASAASKRLQGLLRGAHDRAIIEPQPMYAEDYLTIDWIRRQSRRQQ